VTRKSGPGAGQALVAGGAYLAVSIAYFAVPVLRHFRRDVIGSGSDPQLFVWSLGWWPHAVRNGLNPFVTHLLWAPHGSNLVWATSVPGLAAILAPITLAAGPVAAYNVAAILMPALAATTAFLLCRRLTRSFWPSLAGGYLFGFSSYMLGHELGHLHATSVFLVPLVTLVVLRFLEGAIGGRGLVVRLAPLLALQFTFGTEVLFTLTLCLAAGLVLGVLAVPSSRRRVGNAVLPLAVSYGVGALIVSPFVYYAATDYQGVITPTNHNPVDLVTFAFPTGMAAIGGSLSRHFDPSIPPVSAENGQYLGLPALAIVLLFAVTRWRRAGSRFLVIALLLAALTTLGSELRVRGHALFPLPWRLVRDAPLFDNVIPARFALYVSLVACLIVALWASSPAASRTLRIALTTLAVAALVPNLWHGIWHEHPARPRFFTARLDRLCLQHGETVLVLPPPFRNQGLLWQAESGFDFGLADGALDDAVPHGLPNRMVMLQLIDDNVPPRRAKDVISAALAQNAGAILVTEPGAAQWTTLLDPVLRGRRIGGITLYGLTPLPSSCRQA
jgi:hypothetical protein